MLPQFPPVAPQPRLPSPAASCRRLSTAAFSASAYISAAASDPPRPILRFPRPPAGCPSPLLLPAGLYHPAVSSNLPQPASSLSFSLRPPLPACSPAVSLPPCPHASAVSVRCPSTASSFSRSALPPPLNRCFLHSGGLFDALSLCPISFLQSKKDVPKARLFLQAFFYSLHSSSAAKTSGLQPNTSCQIPRILLPHQTSVRINMRLPENIICR